MNPAYGAYRGLTACLELASRPWALAAARRGGDFAGRFGYVTSRGATWVHAASVGEAAAAEPLVRALLRQRPGDDLLVTAATAGGLAAWRRHVERRAPGAAPVSVAAWPLDFPGAVARAFTAIAPRRLLIVETELWPNVLAEATARGVRVAFANARLSRPRWPATRLLRPLFAASLGRVSACAAQSEQDANRWAALGVAADALCVAGNTKYDRLPPLPSPAERAAARARAGLPEEARLVVFGSLRPGEEPALASAVRALAARGLEVRWVAAPRHPSRAAGQRARLHALGLAVAEWRPGEPWPACDLAWHPSLGVLPALYALADVAVVGGTFAPYGGHNAAEPAALAVPVAVGTHYESTADVVEALRLRGGGRVVVDGLELAEAVGRWVASEPARTEAGRAARLAVEGLAGATARTLGFLEARGFWG